MRFWSNSYADAAAEGGGYVPIEGKNLDSYHDSLYSDTLLGGITATVQANQMLILDFRPTRTTLTVTINGVAASLLEWGVSPTAAGQVSVSYVTGEMEFHADDIGLTVSATYKHYGTVIDARVFNRLQYFAANAVWTEDPAFTGTATFEDIYIPAGNAIMMGNFPISIAEAEDPNTLSAALFCGEGFYTAGAMTAPTLYTDSIVGTGASGLDIPGRTSISPSSAGESLYIEWPVYSNSAAPPLHINDGGYRFYMGSGSAATRSGTYFGWYGQSGTLYKDTNATTLHRVSGNNRIELTSTSTLLYGNSTGNVQILHGSTAIAVINEFGLTSTVNSTGGVTEGLKAYNGATGGVGALTADGLGGGSIYLKENGTLNAYFNLRAGVFTWGAWTGSMQIWDNGEMDYYANTGTWHKFFVGGSAKFEVNGSGAIVTGSIQATDYKSGDGSTGADGTINIDGVSEYTITVKDGLIVTITEL